MIKFDLPPEGKQQTRSAVYDDATGTLAIATLTQDLSIEIDLYTVDIMGDQATLTAIGEPMEYAVDLYNNHCTCQGFAHRGRCKHMQCVRGIKRSAPVKQPEQEPIF
jgi:hypothetical protein